MVVVGLFLFFFFKQKTAYEMRISDWSSDVCSSDLSRMKHVGLDGRARESGAVGAGGPGSPGHGRGQMGRGGDRLPTLGVLCALPWSEFTRDVTEDHRDRKSGLKGKRVSVRVDLGGLLLIKKKILTNHDTENN